MTKGLESGFASTIVYGKKGIEKEGGERKLCYGAGFLCLKRLMLQGESYEDHSTFSIMDSLLGLFW